MINKVIYDIKCTVTALPIYNHTIGKIDMNVQTTRINGTWNSDINTNTIITNFTNNNNNPNH